MDNKIEYFNGYQGKIYSSFFYEEEREMCKEHVNSDLLSSPILHPTPWYICAEKDSSSFQMLNVFQMFLKTQELKLGLFTSILLSYSPFSEVVPESCSL